MRSLRMQLRLPHSPSPWEERNAEFMAAAPASRVIGSKPSDCFQFQDPNTWTCITELASDLVVQVGETSFHLHKSQLISRSGTLKKLVNECTATDGVDGGEDDSSKPCTVVRLDDVPGGAEAFLLAARFCYDVETELNAENVVALRCAAEHLAMTGEGNLVEQTESFLSEVLDGWDDTVRALDACGGGDDDDAVRAAAEDLRIVPRCIDSLADKACADPTLSGSPMLEYYTAKSLEETAILNGIAAAGGAGRPRSPGAEWWYEQASSFGLPVYKRLIAAVRSRGMSPDHVAGSLMHYARRHLSGLRRSSSRGGSRASGTVAVPSVGDQRTLLEEIVALLPFEKGAAPTRFLLGLLRVATVLHAAAACRDALERRAGSQLEEAALEDLLIPNTEYSKETLYDVDSFQRMLEQFMATTPPAFAASPETTDEGQLVDGAPPAELMPVSSVAKLVDGYLAEVGTDPDLKPIKFQTIAALVPDYARAIDDGLYRAIDIYLKAHPWLTDSEREQLCRLMNCQKLSLEASTHAAQNERLPLRVVVQVLFFEQLRLRTTMAGWFFVSDNADRASSSDNCVLPRRRPHDDLDFAAGSEVTTNDDGLATDEDGFVAARDDEPLSPAMSVPKEIHRPRKPKTKSALSRLFGKLGICGRSSPSPSPQLQQQPPPVASDKRSKSFRL